MVKTKSNKTLYIWSKSKKKIEAKAAKTNTISDPITTSFLGDLGSWDVLSVTDLSSFMILFPNIYFMDLMIIDYPAPDSPVKTFNPFWKSKIKSSIIARFLIFIFFNIILIYRYRNDTKKNANIVN